MYNAYYTQNTLNIVIYELSEDNLNLIKGRIKFDDYVNNVSKGQSHIIPCEYDEFQHDNIINRIILYVAKEQLYQKTEKVNYK